MITDQKIALIAAMAENRVIGKDNKLPWKMPADWDHFKKITEGKPFIMGRNSYEAPDKLLSSKKSIILTHKDLDELCDNCSTAESLSEALKMLRNEKEIFILGGQYVFEQSISIANRMYLTIIHAKIEGDAWFPEFDQDTWILVKSEYHEKDRENPYHYSFQEWQRK